MWFQSMDTTKGEIDNIHFMKTGYQSSAEKAFESHSRRITA